MGMYTALEVNLKLKWHDDYVGVLASMMFKLTSADDDDDDDSEERFQRMIWEDGGISFGSHTRRIETLQVPCTNEACDEGRYPTHHVTRVLLYFRSSYKGIDHFDFIDWLRQYIVGGFVRWEFEDERGEQREDFGPLDVPSIIDSLEQEARGFGGFKEQYVKGIRHALAMMRGASGLPRSIIEAFMRNRDDCPRALRHEIEKLL